jgi:protein-L-isoaspartate(D-aspartate) O-methyltransferase
VRPWRSRGAPEDRAERLLATLRGHVDDPRVLAAIREVPRERFVPADLQKEAWDNIALPIGSEQTISQPLVVARMCELLALRGDERVLDVGTGSGYHAAVLARLTAHVWSIEVHPELTERAAASLAGAGIENVTLLTGDGSLGHPEAAPYDAVNVAAAMASVPPALPAQLAEGGRLVGPVDDGDQRLVLLRRDSGGLHESRHERVRFVPLVPRGGVG